MYELKINNHTIGNFRTLSAARAYEPTMVDAMQAGIDPLKGSYMRIIKKLRAGPSNRSNQSVTKSNEAQNESV